MAAPPPAPAPASASPHRLVWWRRLTLPHPRIEVPAERRRVRLAASLLLLLLVLAPVLTFVYRPSSGHAGRDTFVGLGATVLLAVAYVAVRGPRPAVGVWMSVLVPWLAIAATWDPGAVATSDWALLYWGTIPLLLAGLVLPLRSASIFAALHVAQMALLFFSPAGASYPPLQVRDAMIYALIVVGITLLASALLDRAIRDQEATNRRLKEVDHYRVELLNVIAHDLASPLSPIQLQIDLLGRENGNGRRVDVLRRNADHLSRLVQDVKDLAKIEHGRLALLTKPVELGGLARRAVESFQGRAAEAGVDLDAAADGTLVAEADEDRINQVLYNLVTNALKFTPRGGRVQVKAWASEGRARVTVSDTGRGLTEEEMGRLFKPFSQVHERSEVKERGTGLGLFISKGIVEAHGGSMGVASDGHGKGSTFAFDVPLQTMFETSLGRPAAATVR